MDTKIINVYNEKNEKLVSSDLLIVDAAVEPLRVLKVLVEGLPEGRTGLWLNNFKGIPVARTLSPFDLIYLDPEYRVVHCVEISTQGEYEPFRGEPASALVVPPRSIVASKLRPGDRLLFRVVDPSAEARSTPAKGRGRQKPPPHAPSSQPAGAHFYNSAFPVPPPDSVGSLPGFLAGQTQGMPGSGPSATASAEQMAPPAAVSGRLTKSANSLLETAPAFRPSAGDELPSSQHGMSLGSIATAPSSPPPVELAYSVKMPTRLMATPLGMTASSAEQVADPKASGAMPSGRLMRSVNLAPAILPVEEPEIPLPATESAQRELALPTPAPIDTPSDTPAAGSSAAARATPEKRREQTHGIVIPFAAPHQAPLPIQDAPPSAMPMAPEPAAAAATVPVEPAVDAPVASPAASAVALPESSMFIPVASPQPAPPAIAPAATTAAPLQAPRIVEVSAPADSALPQTLVQPPVEPSAADAVLAIRTEPSPYPRTQIKPAEQEQSLAVSQKKKKPSWDVRLLYSIFPEFDPSRPPEIRIPRIGEKEEVVEDEEELSTKLRLLCWLYPDLRLDKHKQRRSEERRAVRLPMPGLVAYFFTGGAPRPHPIKDISVTGFYMCTTERWLPGTIIRVTLQMVQPRPDGGRDSVTVHSRVVRWGPDGGGFEFVLPGFLE